MSTDMSQDVKEELEIVRMYFKDAFNTDREPGRGGIVSDFMEFGKRGGFVDSYLVLRHLFGKNNVYDSYVEHIINPLVEDLNAPYQGVKNQINEARKACEYAMSNNDVAQALRFMYYGYRLQESPRCMRMAYGVVVHYKLLGERLPDWTAPLLFEAAYFAYQSIKKAKFEGEFNFEIINLCSRTLRKYKGMDNYTAITLGFLEELAEKEDGLTDTLAMLYGTLDFDESYVKACWREMGCKARIYKSNVTYASPEEMYKEYCKENTGQSESCEDVPEEAEEGGKESDNKSDANLLIAKFLLESKEYSKCLAFLEEEHLRDDKGNYCVDKSQKEKIEAIYEACHTQLEEQEESLEPEEKLRIPFTGKDVMDVVKIALLTIAAFFALGFVIIIVDGVKQMKEREDYEAQRAINEAQQEAYNQSHDLWLAEEEKILRKGLEEEYDELCCDYQIRYYEDAYPDGTISIGDNPAFLEKEFVVFLLREENNQFYFQVSSNFLSGIEFDRLYDQIMDVYNGTDSDFEKVRKYYNTTYNYLVVNGYISQEKTETGENGNNGNVDEWSIDLDLMYNEMLNDASLEKVAQDLKISYYDELYSGGGHLRRHFYATCAGVVGEMGYTEGMAHNSFSWRVENSLTEEDIISMFNCTKESELGENGTQSFSWEDKIKIYVHYGESFRYFEFILYPEK